MNIVIVGARDRRETEEDKKVVENAIQLLVKQHGLRLHIASAGCDKGIGKLVRDYCLSNKIIFAEARVKLEGDDIPRTFFAHVFLARNLTLREIGDEFYIFKGPNENGIIESLINPAMEKVGQGRVFIYPNN